jgi:AcrR family transcriptional regulator
VAGQRRLTGRQLARRRSCTVPPDVAVSGVAKAVFYRYFADKADLYLAVGREVAERIVGDVMAAVDGERTPHAMVAAGVEAFLVWVERDPDLYRFVLNRSYSASTVTAYSAVLGMHVSRVTGDLLPRGRPRQRGRRAVGVRDGRCRAVGRRAVARPARHDARGAGRLPHRPALVGDAQRGDPGGPGTTPVLRPVRDAPR